MPKPIIIEERKDLLLLQIGTNYEPVQKTSFNLLKYKFYPESNIEYLFNENSFATHVGKVFICKYGPIKIKTDRINDMANSILIHKETGDISEFVKIVSEEHSWKKYPKIFEKITQKFSKRITVHENKYQIYSLFQIRANGYFEYWHSNSRWEHLELGIDKESTPLMITIGKEKFLLSSDMQNSLRKLLFILLLDTSCITAMCKLPKYVKTTFEKIIPEIVPKEIYTLYETLNKTPNIKNNGDSKYD